MAEQHLLEIKDLRVHFPMQVGVVQAVKGIDLHIDRGETIGIVGESGSGKSVGVMSIMRLNETAGGVMPTGSIDFLRRDGTVVDIAAADAELLQQIRGNEISMIFQEPMTCLNPVLSIGLQLTEPLTVHQNKTPEEARDDAIEMLKLVRIPEPEKRLEQYPHHLSGGMRQRVMIAMALCCRPALLVADEPTTALDVTIQAQILDLLKDIQERMGMGVIFITHDMAVVAEMADRVVVMFNGNVVETGPVEQIFHDPQHEYTKKLINAVPRLGSMRGKSAPEKFPEIGV